MREIEKNLQEQNRKANDSNNHIGKAQMEKENINKSIKIKM